MTHAQAHSRAIARRLLKKQLRQCWQLYLFLLIPVVYILLFHYVPMFGVQIAFRKFSFTGGIWNSPWVGMANFQKFFQSYQFRRVLPNTLRISIYSLVAGFPFPIILALGLNAMRNQGYKKAIQTITYIPHFISTVVLVGMIFRVFNPRIGLYGIFGTLLTGEQPRDILGMAIAFPHMYVWSGIWQNMGWGTIIYIAALSGVDTELHEAAQIDGASRFQRIRFIDFPSILPTAVILLILNTGHIMSVGFEKVYLMQNSLNLSTSEVISTYVYKVGIASGGGDFSYATAIGLFNSAVNMLVLVSVNAISKAVGETSLW